ncbi:hypothetical protein AVEN_226380-1 [Araneus ventricosus]|uniref:Uncharacterized protein n=1 Tax=Araneus ventricosus TaxID=182803 RepID=A0A4Y2SKM5_ARAVE|nr:hypothetical protein AVEN_226380-1 [Araneus ventricosus]
MTTPELPPPLLNSAPHQMENVLLTTSDLMCTKPTYMVDLQRNWISNLKPFEAEAGSLPLGDHGSIHSIEPWSPNGNEKGILHS